MRGVKYINQDINGRLFVEYIMLTEKDILL